jgi:hypothetical protein
LNAIKVVLPLQSVVASSTAEFEDALGAHDGKGELVVLMASAPAQRGIIDVDKPLVIADVAFPVTLRAPAGPTTLRCRKAKSAVIIRCAALTVVTAKWWSIAYRLLFRSTCR